MKWNMVWLLLSFEIGGKTPRASQVSRMMLLGCLSEIQGIFALWMYSIGYALEVSVHKIICGNLCLPSGVLGQCRIFVIYQTGFGAEDNVLEDRSEFNGVKDIRLLLR